MKKFSCILTASLFVIVIYMLIVWFFVPANSYRDFFATEKLMRSVSYEIIKVLSLNIVIIAVFVGLSLLFSKKLKNSLLLVLNLSLPSICAFCLNVFYLKRMFIGVGGDYYAPHTIVETIPTISFNVTMFDILFALLIGGIATLLTTYLTIKTRKK